MPPIIRLALGLALGALPLSIASAQVRDDDASTARLVEQLRSRATAHRGRVAVAVKDLTTGATVGLRADEPMPTASLIKLAVMVTAYRLADAGEVDLASTCTLRDEDRVPGAGILAEHFSTGASIRLRDAIRLMIAFSDNTATNLVLDRIGVDATNAAMKALGCDATRLHSKMYARDTSTDPAASKRYGVGRTSAADAISLLERLVGGTLVSKTADAEMLAHLTACRSRSMLPRFLPTDTPIAHKTGSQAAARCDAGVITAPAGPIVICVLTADNADRRFTAQNAAERLIGRIGRDVYRHFNGRREAPVRSTLRLGDTGQLVEDLQRTLNARLDGDDLSVDGDFGPATEAAVRRFQEAKAVEPDGVVSDATWRALGVLVTRDKPVPDPDVVNAERLERAPPDALDGVPFVTCRAWAIADGDTGDVLHEHAGKRALPFASVTKVMTAHIALSLARREPAVLDEVVTISRRADDTPGSTAAVRAGETLPLRELLYGLMLPSGNDAATAIAEHLGARFAPDGAGGDPLAHFVAEMNRTARALGMTSTRYRNPHGLSARGHRASAIDLLRLVRAALDDPRFRALVTTRQYGYRITGPGGYRRNLLWKNTNRLLAIEGYGGVKTGTTRAAGACLASMSERDGKRLLLVVLGAQSSAARYTDSRNLYRWAWLQRRER